MIGFVLVVALLFWIAKSILKVLSLVAPVLLVAAVIINHKVVIGYGRWLLDSIKRNPVFGIIAVLFTILGFPIVSMFLLLRALASKGMARAVSQKGEFIKYEEVNEDFLDISDIKKHKKKLDNDYNDVF